MCWSHLLNKCARIEWISIKFFFAWMDVVIVYGEVVVKVKLLFSAHGLFLSMDPKAEQHKPPRTEEQKHLHQKLSVSPLTIEDIHRHSPLMLSPRSLGSSAKPSSTGGGSHHHHGRWNCLCSPTTHAGSFRCRLHRGSGISRAHHSVGANLSDLGAKSPSSIIDSLRAQQPVPWTLHVDVARSNLSYCYLTLYLVN